jgi:hypothetical protein
MTMSIMVAILKRIGALLAGEKLDGRRNTFFVEKEFQKSFILFFLVMVSFLIIASGGAYYIMHRSVLEESMYMIHPKFTNIRDVLTPNLILFFIEVSCIAFIIIIVTVDRIMKRIAKSLMSYERIAERLAKLDFKKAKAIETKLFPDLHRQYMDLIDKCSTDVSLLREKMIRINMLLTLLEESGDLSKEKKTLAMTELIELKGDVESKLKEYKLDELATSV